MERVAGRGDADRFEIEVTEFFERVRQAYLQRAAEDPGRFRIIDASGDEEQVWRQVERALDEALGP
jgi:dTMP kinase